MSSVDLHTRITIPSVLILAILLVIAGYPDLAVVVIGMGAGAVIVDVTYRRKETVKSIQASSIGVMFMEYGLMLGITDALLVEEWTIKAFMWAIILSILALTISLLHVKILDTLIGLIGMHMGYWNIAWMITTIMLGKPVFIDGKIWVMPNIIIPAWLYLIITITALILHIYWFYIRKRK